MKELARAGDNIPYRYGKIAGLNFCGFNPTEVFAEILSRFLSQKYLLLKRGASIYRKTYTVLALENCGNHEI